MLGVRALALGLCLLASAGRVSGAEPAPYAGWRERSIKALSAEQVEDLLNGRGMGLALPAELNGYPGPRHVLELADQLELTPDQLTRTRSLFEAMRARAVALGEEIVAREALLDELFASGTATAEALHEATAALGRLSGQLRAHHLDYHLAMRALLDARQIDEYQRLRGYAAAAGAGRGHHHQHSRHGGQQ
jgi:Spy/CpxP family protein refolding chaperone